MHFSHIPLAVMTDSYKTTHPSIYPEAQRMVAYGEMRQAYDKDPSDNRMVAYGIRYMYVSLGHQVVPSTGAFVFLDYCFIACARYYLYCGLTHGYFAFPCSCYDMT